jgi:hypothetical protein
MTRDYPLLLHVVVANSAMHLVNLFNPPQISGSGPVIQRLHRHALSAKCTALRLLKDSLGDATPDNWVIVLASIVLFIDYELINSGKTDWNVHVQGARRLIACFDSPHDSTDSCMPQLRDFAISDSIT